MKQQTVPTERVAVRPETDDTIGGAEVVAFSRGGANYRYEKVTTGVIMDDLRFNKGAPSAGDPFPDFDLMTTAAPATKASFFPPPDRKVLIALALSGVAATIAFDVFGQFLSPAAGFTQLDPVGLAKIVIAKLFGVSTAGGAIVLHFLTGLLLYPFGYLFAARPIARAVAPRTPWWVVGAIYGAILWLWAVYVMAHLVGGLPAFFGFSEFAWVALVGHILFGWVTAAVIRWHLG